MKKYKISIENKLILGNMYIELSEQEVKHLVEQYNKPTHKRKYFVPKIGEKYYSIDYTSTIDSTNTVVKKYLATDEDLLNYRISIGNCFATEQDAQDELNRRQSLVRIWNNYDDKYSWDIDWEDYAYLKYGIAYDYDDNRFVTSNSEENIDYSINLQISTELPYFKSAEDRNQFVEENRDDLLTIFNIKK